MNRKIVIILGVIIHCSLMGNAQFIVSNGDEISCQELMDAFMENDVVCIWNSNTSVSSTDITITNVEGCDLKINTGQELRIQNLIKVKLDTGVNITLTGDGAKLKGDNMGGSEITKDNEDGSAVIMDENCVGCSVTDIGIKGDDTHEVTGIEIEKGSSDSEVTAVKFEELGTGIKIDSDGNRFYDLHFLNVGTDREEGVEDTEWKCWAEDNGNAAIWLNEAHNNEIINVMHRASPGAITLWLKGACHNNTALNLTVEQEGSKCLASGTDDPAIYFTNTSSGNYIITNFNGAGVRIINATPGIDICDTNTISYISICNGANLSNCNN